jgi:hypothetical protein
MLQARVGDYSVGHWIGNFYFPPSALVTGSSDDSTTTIQSCKVGDKANPHIGWLFGFIPCPMVVHIPIASTGAPSNNIDNLPAFRVGDSYACGDTQSMGAITDMVGNSIATPSPMIGTSDDGIGSGTPGDPGDPVNNNNWLIGEDGTSLLDETNSNLLIE